MLDQDRSADGMVLPNVLYSVRRPSTRGVRGVALAEQQQDSRRWLALLSRYPKTFNGYRRRGCAWYFTGERVYFC